MTSTTFDPEAYIEAAAPLLGLTLTPESKAETALQLRVAAAQAELLMMAGAMDEREEPAPVFVA